MLVAVEEAVFQVDHFLVEQVEEELDAITVAETLELQTLVVVVEAQFRQEMRKVAEVVEAES